MSTRGAGAGLTAVGTGLMQFGQQSEERRFAREREENMMRLQQEKMDRDDARFVEEQKLRERELDATVDYRSNTLDLQGRELDATVQGREADRAQQAEQFGTTTGLQGEELDLKRQEIANRASETEETLKLKARELDMSQAQLDNETSKVELAYLKEGYVKDPDTDRYRWDAAAAQRNIEALRAARSVGSVSSTESERTFTLETLRLLRAEGAEELQGKTDGELRQMAQQQINSKPLDVSLPENERLTTVRNRIEAVNAELADTILMQDPQVRAAKRRELQQLQQDEDRLLQEMEGRRSGLLQQPSGSGRSAPPPSNDNSFLSGALRDVPDRN